MLLVLPAFGFAGFTHLDTYLGERLELRCIGGREGYQGATHCDHFLHSHATNREGSVPCGKLVHDMFETDFPTAYAGCASIDYRTIFACP